MFYAYNDLLVLRLGFKSTWQSSYRFLRELSLQPGFISFLTEENARKKAFIVFLLNLKHVESPPPLLPPSSCILPLPGGI